MTFNSKNRIEFLYKQLIQLKKNVQNRKKLREFKKQKHEKLMQSYRQKLRRYYKLRHKSQHLVLVFCNILQNFGHKKYFKSFFYRSNPLK